MDKWTAVWLCVIIALVYAILSGFWGVVVTDLVQFIIAMFGSIALAIIALNHIGGMEILPIAHPSAETGPPQPDVVELARVTDRGIRESGMLDMKQLVLEKDKSVIGVFCDNAVTDHDGNLFDACSYASTAAINSCKIPKYEMQAEKSPKILPNPSRNPPQTFPEPSKIDLKSIQKASWTPS